MRKTRKDLTTSRVKREAYMSRIRALLVRRMRVQAVVVNAVIPTTSTLTPIRTKVSLMRVTVLPKSKNLSVAGWKPYLGKNMSRKSRKI